jgi:hypothetical protein
MKTLIKNPKISRSLSRTEVVRKIRCDDGNYYSLEAKVINADINSLLSAVGVLLYFIEAKNEASVKVYAKEVQKELIHYAPFNE